MIILNCKNVKLNQKLIDEYENILNFSNIVCPRCSSTDYIFYGCYSRNILYIENGVFIENTIKIKRIMCKGCNHTHAIIPSFIVPYKQFSLDLIIGTIKDKINNNLYKNNNITRQLIKKWLKIYFKQESKLQVMYEEFNKNNLIEKIYKEIELASPKYFNQNRELFLVLRSNIFYNYVPT